jgi:hypothetical protein
MSTGALEEDDTRPVNNGPVGISGRIGAAERPVGFIAVVTVIVVVIVPRL